MATRLPPPPGPWPPLLCFPCVGLPAPGVTRQRNLTTRDFVPGDTGFLVAPLTTARTWNHPSTDPLTSGWTRSAAAVRRGHSAVSEGLTPAPRLGRAWATSRPATAPRLACSPCANALRGSTGDLGGRAGGSTSHQVGARAPPSLLALRTVSAAGADGAKSPPGKCGAAVGPRLGAETALPSFQ